MIARERPPLAGVRQIVRYNWPKYAAAVGVVVGGIALIAFTTLPTPADWILGAAVAGAALLTVASLLASLWVYDLSGFYDFGWALRVTDEKPERWTAVHAGLDEVSRGLARTLGSSPDRVVDIYDERLMSEPSIERARRLAGPDEVSVRASHAALPLESGSLDAVYVVFAAHELRAAHDRRALFAEITRALRPGGRVVVVEHLRDPWNLAVFGPGAFHFWSRSTWLGDLKSAGLAVTREQRHTPFVRIFVGEHPG